MTRLAGLARELEGQLEGRVLLGAPLAPYTSFRVGGPAAVLVEAESEADLVRVAEVVGGRAPVAVVGRGSNLLVSDEGFDGVAGRLGRGFRRHRRTERGLELGGAVSLPAAARLAARLGLEGLEFAAEIPGQFGGAVRMNAGAHGRCMADVLVWARTVDLGTAEVRTWKVEELGYAYRRSALPEAAVVTAGEVALGPADPSVVAARIAGLVRWRREHQPPGRSAGSVFKNPPGDAAGRLIEAAGCKGWREGGAEVSEVHANFVVAHPGATAADVWRLVVRVRAAVRERFGVELEPEVRFLGPFPQVEEFSEVHVEG